LLSCSAFLSVSSVSILVNMLYSRLAFAFLASALLGGVTADLTIIVPGGPNLWWVDQSENTLIWTCQDSSYTQFNVLIANSNVNLLTAPLPIISSLDNFDCSRTITSDMFNLQAGTGYTIQLTDIFNDTDVYATSQPFEIKAFGSSYPDSTATPTASGTSSGSSGPSGTQSSAKPSGTAKGSTGGGIKSSLSGLAAFVAVALGVVVA